MPRKKTRHTQITSESVRNSTLKRRQDSLFKTANELSILCGIEVLIVIHNPNEGHSTLWPSQDVVMDGIVKFLTYPERERLKKMVLQEKFLTDKLQDMAEKLLKLQNKNDETEMRLLVNQLTDGKTFDELNVRELNDLYHLVDEKLKGLQNRIAEFDAVQGRLSLTDISRNLHPSFQVAEATSIRKGQDNGAFARASITTLTEDMSEDKWFSNTMTGIHNNLHLFEGTNMEPEANVDTSFFFEGNQGEFVDEVWPVFFSA